jgi:hypothetical protein
MKAWTIFIEWSKETLDFGIFSVLAESEKEVKEKVSDYLLSKGYSFLDTTVARDKMLVSEVKEEVTSVFGELTL